MTIDIKLLKQLNCIPEKITDSISYLITTGSHAYGTALPNSDVDLFGIYVPPKEYFYPQEYGYINGFNEPPELEKVYQVHHVYDGATEYDINIFDIRHYFKLAAQGNPNIIDTLYSTHIHHCDRIGKLIMDNKNLFLSKASYPRFLGMIDSHIRGLFTPKKTGRREGLIAKYGFDTKDCGHIIRIQWNMIRLLQDGCYDLKTDAEFIKKVRNGDFKLASCMEIIDENRIMLKKLMETTVLQENVDYKKITTLLQQCIDIQYPK